MIGTRMSFVIVFVGLLGLCIGSFIEALTWRLHENNKKFSILKGRSICPHCGRRLSALELIPVVSWVIQKGRCRQCQASLGWQYPAIEMFTAAVFVISYMFWPFGLNEALPIVKFGLWLALLSGLIALFIYDLRWLVLPDRILKWLYLFAGTSLLIDLAEASNASNFIVAMLLGLAVSSGFFFAIYQFSKGKWIGGGDVKLGVVYGLLLHDPLRSALVLFIASLGGTLIVLPGILTRKVKLNQKLPFGPLLIIGIIVSYLFGGQLINWYENSFLLLSNR